MSKRRRSWSGLAIGVAALAWGSTVMAKDLVIHAGRLIDGVSAQTRANVSILVHDDRITAVEAGFVTPHGAEVVDLSKATVLPGLIDCHDHITSYFDGGNPIAEAVTVTNLDAAFVSVAAAKATLEAGFTTIRDVGADPYVIIALKKAIQKGEIEGPRTD